jgi:hypothetical protein
VLSLGIQQVSATLNRCSNGKIFKQLLLEQAVVTSGLQRW